jgi:hypothetical protein
LSKSSRRARPGSRPAGEPPAPGQTTRPSASGGEHRSGTGSVRPASARAGRRERARPIAEKPLLERFRLPIVAVVLVATVALLAVWAVNSAGAAAYACSVEFQAAPTASPGPDASGEPGYVQEAMGNAHVAPGSEVTYTFCPPASGGHFNAEGRGPITPRVYGPGDRVTPQGWVHNLEHGALVVLYRGREGDPGLTEATQEALRTFAAGIGDSPVCGRPANQYLIVARFDEMASPFAALVWGRILPLQTLDTAAIERFWDTVGEQVATMPERFGCPEPGASPATSPATSPSPG